jgi:simple sugar transport system ATP-binding protein
VSQPLLSLRGITKSFAGVPANDRVDFDARPGEVHALLGENGAGKSTLMKVAYGYHSRDAGSILVDGTPVDVRSPRDARRLGVGMVFQSFSLILGFTVAENIALYLPEVRALPDFAAIEREIRERSERLGFHVDPHVKAGLLAAGDQQKVEILKLLMGGARVLIFDEPTSVLPPHEIDSLFQVFDRLREAGYAVVFITHKLHEVLQCADRITVMRKGRVTATRPREGATEAELLRLMFGSTDAAVHQRSRMLCAEPTAPVALQLDGVSSGGAGLPLRDIDLQVRQGEVVGVAGVSGNGQRELGDVVLGLLPVVRGRRRLFGADTGGWSVASIRNAGVAFVPEDPGYMAVVPGLSLAENFALVSPRTYQRRAGLGMDWRRVRSDMATAYRTLELDPPDSTLRAAELSGGNLQRFALARELGRAPRLIVALYPTRGLDAMTAAHAQSLLDSSRRTGAAVLLMSQELTELFELADRIVVLRGGHIAGTVRPAESSPLEVGRMMTGGS